MNTYVFLIYNGTSFVDISNYVQTNTNIQDKLDITLDVGSFTIPYIKADAISGFDMSKAIKPWTPIIIRINATDVYRMYVSDSNCSMVKKSDPKLYKHEIGLVEASKVLQRKIIPNMTVTQPKSLLYNPRYFSESKTSQLTINDKDSYTTIPFELNRESEDTSVIEGRVIKAGKTAIINFTADLLNEQYNYTVPWYYIGWNDGREDGDATLEVKIYANATLIGTTTMYMLPGVGKQTGETDELVTPYAESFGYSIQRTAVTNETITVQVRTMGVWEDKWDDPTGPSFGSNYTDDILKVTPYLTIGADSDVTEYFIYLDTAVDKVLTLMNVKDVDDTTADEYTLYEDTRHKIENVLCPEFTFTSYTAWDALEKIANVVHAIPEIGTKGFNVISFIFLDEIPDMVYDASVFTEETTSHTMEEYNTGLEINASNVIEEDILKSVKVEPYTDGWMTIRANSASAGQIVEENAAFKVRQNIYRIYKMFIKGVQVRIYNGSAYITLNGNDNADYTQSTYWDISDRVVETSRWNTFENGTSNGTAGAQNPVQRLSVNTKGNHIHYTQGTKFVLDLGYKTDTLSDFFGTTSAPRALMEVILATAQQYVESTSALLGYYIEPTTSALPEKAIVSGSQVIGATTYYHPIFDGVLAQLQYIPMADVRSTLYKPAIFDMDVDVTNFINEQDKLNDTINLGEYVRKSINKLGNLNYTVSGKEDEFNKIPKLGYMTPDNLVVVSRNLNLQKNLISYDLELSKDFINQSSYVGLNSAYRQFEIPSEDTVFRQDKYREFVILTKDPAPYLPFDFTGLVYYGKAKLIQNFTNSVFFSDTPVSYGKATITKVLGSSETDNVVIFDMPLNGYAIGNTLNLQVEMDSNYSVGPMKYTTEIGSTIEDTYTGQSYTEYTDNLGQAYSMDLSLYYKGVTNNTEADANLYPTLSQNTVIGPHMHLSLILNKDAREKYGLNIEFPFITDDPDNIRIFPGIAKYNGWIRNRDDIELKVALLDSNYFPSINATKLETARTTPVTELPTGVYDSVNEILGIEIQNIDIPSSTSWNGYVIYEGKTKDIIYAVKEAIVNSTLSTIQYDAPTVWFAIKKHLKNNLVPIEPNIWIYTGDTISVPAEYGVGDLPSPYNTILASDIFEDETEIIFDMPSSTGINALVTGYKWVETTLEDYNMTTYKINKDLLINFKTTENDAKWICIPTFNTYDHVMSNGVMRINNGLGYDYWRLTEVVTINDPKLYISE